MTPEQALAGLALLGAGVGVSFAIAAPPIPRTPDNCSPKVAPPKPRR